MLEATPWSLIYKRKVLFITLVAIGCLINAYIFHYRNELKAYEPYADLANSYFHPVYKYWLSSLETDTSFAVRKLRPDFAIYMKFFSISQLTQSLIIAAAATAICFKRLGHLDYDRKDIIVCGLVALYFMYVGTLLEHRLGTISNYIDEGGVHAIKQTLYIQGLSLARDVLIINVINIVVNIIRER